MPYTAAQLTAYYTAINFGQAPDATLQATFATAATNNASGGILDQQALLTALRNVQVYATTDVAVAVYQYFNGSAPSQAGLNFLINTPGSGLNTVYYNGSGLGTAAAPGPGGFNLENRYYNLSVSQAFQGPNAAAFAATYGALSLQQTVAQAYEQIVGAAVVGAPQAAAAIAAIQGSIPFFQQIAAERAKEFNQDLAAKAIIVGYILEESIKANVGAYALAMDQHNAAIAAGTAVYNANILTTYAPGGPGYGIGVGGGLLPTNLTAGSGIAQQRVNLAAGGLIGVFGSMTGGLTLQLRDASGPTDTLLLSIGNTNTTNAQGVAGVSINGLSLGGTAAAGVIETLAVTSTGNPTSAAPGSDNNIVLNPATAPNTVTIRGSPQLTLITGAVTHSMLLDGSLANGGLTLRGDGATAAGVAININGGAANDTLEPGLSSTTVSQSIYGGRGGDLILLNGGAWDRASETVVGAATTHKPINTLVYKAVANSLLDFENEPGASRTSNQFATSSSMDVVAGFISGQDKIDLKAVGLTQAQLSIADKGVIADEAAFNALVASGNLFKDGGGVTRGVSELHNNGDTYLLIDVNHNGVLDLTADMAIKLIGLVAASGVDLVGN